MGLKRPLVRYSHFELPWMVPHLGSGDHHIRTSQLVASERALPIALCTISNQLLPHSVDIRAKVDPRCSDLVFLSCNPVGWDEQTHSTGFIALLSFDMSLSDPITIPTESRTTEMKDSGLEKVNTIPLLKNSSAMLSMGRTVM